MRTTTSTDEIPLTEAAHIAGVVELALRRWIKAGRIARATLTLGDGRRVDVAIVAADWGDETFVIAGTGRIVTPTNYVNVKLGDPRWGEAVAGVVQVRDDVEF